MAKIKIDNYTFDKTAKTVTFTDYSSILLNSILLITNTTDGIIIYNFADSNKVGTVLNNILTLAYNTSAMDNLDKLLIYYDDPTYHNATDETLILLGTMITTMNDMSALLMRMLTQLDSLSVVDSAMRQRVSIDSTVALPADQTVNVNKITGTTTSVNVGLSDAGSQRVTISTNSQIDNTEALLNIAYDNRISQNLIFTSN